MVYVEVIPHAAPGVMMLRIRATEHARDQYEAVSVHRGVSACGHSWHSALCALEQAR
jgi:hypothetical protein